MRKLFIALLACLSLACPAQADMGFGIWKSVPAVASGLPLDISVAGTPYFGWSTRCLSSALSANFVVALIGDNINAASSVSRTAIVCNGGTASYSSTAGTANALISVTCLSTCYTNFYYDQTGNSRTGTSANNHSGVYLQAGACVTTPGDCTVFDGTAVNYIFTGITGPVTPFTMAVYAYENNAASTSIVPFSFIDHAISTWEGHYIQNTLNGSSVITLSAIEAHGGAFPLSAQAGGTAPIWNMWSGIFASATSRTACVGGTCGSANATSSTPTGSSTYALNLGVNSNNTTAAPLKGQVTAAIGWGTTALTTGNISSLCTSLNTLSGAGTC